MPSGYFRYPTIQSDQVVFTCEDDLWVVPAQGGIARRLTSNLGEVSWPMLSPDGRWLAFVGRDEGQAEIYLMPSLGGPARRLTYLGGTACQTVAWSPEGKIIFSSNAGHWYPRATFLYQIDPEGGMPDLLPYGLASNLSYGPQGRLVIGRIADDPAHWKRYRGGRTGQIWVDQSGQGTFELLTSLNGNLAAPMWIGERIYFISDHEGVGNIYSCLPDGQAIQRHTDHKELYARNPATDGNRIVYHAGGDLYLYSLTEDTSQLLPVEFYSPQTQRNRKFVDPGRYLENWMLHPSGMATTISARGKIFAFFNWEGAVIQYGKRPATEDPASPTTGVRYRLPTWMNDGERLLVVSDEGGEEAFAIFTADNSGEPEHLSGLDIGRPDEIAINPARDQLVFSNHRYELIFVDLETKQQKLIDRGLAGPIDGFDWSPDGEWVVYSVSVSLKTSALKLWKVGSESPVQITEPVLDDYAPVFSPDGEYIYFLSQRIFDPVFDSLQLEMGFPSSVKPYLITLRKDQISPFIPIPPFAGLPPEPEEETTSTEELDQPAGEPEKSADILVEEEPGTLDTPDDRPEVPEEHKMQIDLDGIQGRIIPFPVSEGRYGRIFGTRSGKVVYSRYPIEGMLDEDLEDRSSPRGSLMVYDFEDQKEDFLVYNVSDFGISRDASWIIYRSRARLRILKAGEKPQEDRNPPSRRTGWLDLDRVKVSVLPGAEWRQMFREAWRLQRDQFWTPDMSQVDWLAIHDRYLPLVDRVSSRSEFSDLMWEMQGELGTSHAFEFGGDYRSEPDYRQGYLGAEYAYDPESSGWKIIQIHHGDGWAPGSDSPLNKPGVNIGIGSILLAINGRPLSEKVSPAKALVNLAEETVILTVLSPGESTPRQVTVETLHSEVRLRYREWVNHNRQRVHEATQGRMGYVHIPNMGPWGFAEFHRGYLAEVDREGLIVDVRFNSGGYVSALLLEKLARRRIGYSAARWRQVPRPYPPDSVLGPMVALTNEYASSDGDIFSHGFKLMNLGPLVGKRTWGGVTGYWPRHSLVDGTLTTQPEVSTWFQDVGWGIENYGADPDIVVDITPQDYGRDEDPQLERAIAEGMKAFHTSPPQLPDFTNKPSRALPKLPDR
jgi:tricorn protease